jgi:hypothetical protein
MASPQLENGHIKIANELLENLICYKFSQHAGSTPISICLFVIRKTWGFHKPTDQISITQFEKAVKTSRPTIVFWLKYLVKAGLLVKGALLDKNGSEYSFNKNYDAWIPLVKVLKLVKVRTFTSKGALTETSKGAITHKRKKEIQKKAPRVRGELKTYGEAGSIALSSPEYRKLRQKVGQHADEFIQKVENWKLSKPKKNKYDDDYRGILNWITRAMEDGKLALSIDDFSVEDFDTQIDFEKKCESLLT